MSNYEISMSNIVVNQEGKEVVYKADEIEWITFRMKDGSENKVIWSSIESMHVKVKGELS